MVRCEEAAIKHAGKLEVGMLENYGKQTNRQGFSLLLETPIPCGNLRGIKDRFFFFAWTLSLTCFNVLDACRKWETFALTSIVTVCLNTANLQVCQPSEVQKFRRKERLFNIVGKELFASILITDHILYFPLIFEKNHRLFHPIPEKTHSGNFTWKPWPIEFDDLHWFTLL